MLRRLAGNTAVSAAAFLVVSVVGLLLVPLLVGAYGIEEFGLITVLRLLTPLAALSIVDVGFGEQATQAVARSRASSDWEPVAVTVGGLFALAAVVSIACAATIVGAAPWLADRFGVSPAHRDGFVAVVRASGVALLALFPGLLAEGILKGFEAYRRLRALEVWAALGYAAAAWAAVAAGAGYETVCYAFLASVVLRAFVAGELARRLLATRVPRLSLPRGDARRAFTADCRRMLLNKQIGVAQGPLPQVAVGVLLGPAAVGLYDVVTRLPRFAKSVLGLLNSGVLPAAAALDQAGDRRRMGVLVGSGMLMVALAIVPPMFGVAAVSDRVLGLWLGAEFGRFGPWTGGLFALTSLTSLVGFVAVSMMVRRDAFIAMNRVAMMQVALMYGVAVLTLNSAEGMSFVLGQLIGSLAVMPWQARMVSSTFSLPDKMFFKVGSIVALASLPAVARLVPSDPLGHSPIALLSLAVAALVLAQWIVAYRLVLDDADRARVRGIAGSLLPSRP